MITETDELAAALDSAAQRYPGLSRAQLLARLALEGHEAAQHAQEERRRVARLQAETGLRMPDCCVLLAGQDAAARIAVVDDRLFRTADGLGLVALRS